MVQSIFIEDSSCQVARKGVFCERVPRISGFQVAHYIVRVLTFGKQYFLQCTTILPKLHGSINFYRGFILSNSKKGVFCDIMPRISGFQVAHTIVRLLTVGKQYFLQCTTILPKSRGSINFYRGFTLSGSKKRGFLSKSAPDFWFPGGAYYCQTSHFWKIVFSSMYHNIAKIMWFNQFLLRIHLVRQQEKGFSVKQCPRFLVSRWRILLSDFSLLENTIFFNMPQYCQNRMVQSIFIEDSSCQVARKGVFCERVPRISGFQVAHYIVRVLTFGKQYFLQCTTILPKLHGSINFYRGFILSDSKKGVFCDIMPRISGFQVAHTIVRLLTVGKQYFLQCTTILPKSRGSINFYRGFTLSGSKKRGFLSKSAPDFWFPGGAYYCQTSHFWKIVFSSMYHNIAKIMWFNQFLLRIQSGSKKRGFL